MRSVRVHYRVADLAGIDPADVVALDRYRNAAAALVEAVLEAAGEGRWLGSGDGGGELEISFEIEDFDRAEALIRAALMGTPHAGFDRLERYDDDDAEYGDDGLDEETRIALRWTGFAED